MDLTCRDGIIVNGLAVHIDINDIKSWDLNTGFTVNSLTKWTGAYSEKNNLHDFGLTNFDFGLTNEMHGNLELTTKDNKLKLHRIGFNQIQNPTTGDTGIYSATTSYDGYGMTGITTGDTGNYFELNGGYLHGFFKLDGYNFKVFPERIDAGITIENLLFLKPESVGMFLFMGIRSEDKYIPYFSGETTFKNNEFDGVYTSDDEFLHGEVTEEFNRKAFKDYEDMKGIRWVKKNNDDNINGNLIGFGIGENGGKRLFYKYIDDDGNLITNHSNTTIENTGMTLITITFRPDIIIGDPDLLECFKRRTGKLLFYVNGRATWIINDFPEFFFRRMLNDRSKQIGVPYSISWGGGTFGLKHSWHYDILERTIFSNQNSDYIINNFDIDDNV